MLPFLASPLLRPLLAGVAILAILGGAWFKGWEARGHHDKAAEAAREARAALVVRAAQRASAALSEASRADLDRTQAENHTRTITLIRKVPIYVTAKDDADCRVPDGLVRLHDAAALGLPDVPAGASESKQSARVALSDLTGTVVGNYGQALDWRAEALTWRAWYAAQAKAWPVK
jgi:hypothetical protein